jgi:phospholipid/cholesterol/gamma-HCH transport system substrate-binding protein
MSTNYKIANAKLGALVIAGLLFLVLTLYMIGKNQNIFGSSITIVSVVEDVSGLMAGNNVRYKGMNIGTVRSVEMAEDGKIHVRAYVRERMKHFIQMNSYTSISTDGLMGNKLLLIVPVEGEARTIDEGDTLYARPGTDMDNLLGKLDESSDYLAHTLSNLALVSDRLADSNALWELLADSVLTNDLRESVASFREVGRQSREIARVGRSFLQTLEAGDGLVSRLFTDTVMVGNLEETLEQFQSGSTQAVRLLEDISEILQKVEDGEGAAGMFLTDSAARQSLANTLLNIELSTENFNQNMEALKHNFLFRRYFRRQEQRNLSDD